MGTRFQFVHIVFFAAVVALSGFADWTKLSETSFRMGDPPEEGSAADQKDFASLHHLQDSRTKSDCDEGREQLSHTFENFYGPESGQLTPKQFDRYEDLFKRVFKLTARISGHFKDSFERPRPYITDSTITPCIPKPGPNRSYPSTHAALGMVGGCLLAQALPAKAEALEDHAKRIGELRAIVGVHHPTDVSAGQKLGRQICEKLAKDTEFAEELGL